MPSLDALPDAIPNATLGTGRAACTIVSPNYLAYARTVAESYLAHHPDQRFFVLLVARTDDLTLLADEVFTTVSLAELGVDDLLATAMKYEILELNTNVKPTFLKHLLAKYELEVLTYLDPDIFCYAPFEPVVAALEGFDAVLTPHLTTPIFNGKQPSEQDLLYNGTYNLGFLAVRNTPAARGLLDWWERRCLDLGFSEGRTGLFVDQKWMNLAPGLFEGVAILRHRGCNMAYWNLNDRGLGGDATQPLVDGSERLCFFHFSGLALHDPASLSKNTNRYTLATRPNLLPIFAAYKAAVLAHADPQLQAIPTASTPFLTAPPFIDLPAASSPHTRLRSKVQIRLTPQVRSSSLQKPRGFLPGKHNPQRRPGRSSLAPTTALKPFTPCCASGCGSSGQSGMNCSCAISPTSAFCATREPS